MTPTSYSQTNVDQLASYGLPLLLVGPQGADPANATTDMNEFKERWQRAPTAGVAVATGSTGSLIGLVVEGPEARAELAELEARHGELVTTTTLSQHQRVLLLTVPAGFKVPTLPRLPGSTLGVQGEGGKVLLPPSTDEHGENLCWRMMPNHGPAPTPTWLLEWIRAASINVAGMPPVASVTPAANAASLASDRISPLKVKVPRAAGPAATADRTATADRGPATMPARKQSNHRGRTTPVVALLQPRPGPSACDTNGLATKHATQAPAKRPKACRGGRSQAAAMASSALRPIPKPPMQSKGRPAPATKVALDVGSSGRSDRQRTTRQENSILKQEAIPWW